MPMCHDNGQCTRIKLLKRSRDEKGDFTLSSGIMHKRHGRRAEAQRAWQSLKVWVGPVPSALTSMSNGAGGRAVTIVGR